MLSKSLVAEGRSPLPHVGSSLERTNGKHA